MTARTIESTWRVFLVKRILAQEYSLYSAVQTLAGPQDFVHPVLDSVLPGSFLIQVFAVADEALEALLEERGVIPRNFGFKNDAYGRIQSAYKIGALADAGPLHAAREDRNRCSHEAEFVLTWNTLDKHVSSIGAALTQLGHRTTVPKLEVTAERVPFDDLDGTSGFRCSITVHEGVTRWAKHEWSMIQVDE